MAENVPARQSERRGVDTALLSFLRQWLNDFETGHLRLHQAADKTTQDALELTASRFAEDIAALREHFNTVLTERDHRYEERFNASQVAVQAALVEREKAVASAFVASEKAIEAAFEASKEAIIKSEVGVEKRADAVYVTLAKLQEALAAVMPRSEAENRYAAQQAIINELRNVQDTNMLDIRDRLKTVEAAKAGKVELLPWVLAVAAVLGLLLTLVRH